MDNPNTESSSFDTNQAADAFSSLLAGEPIDKRTEESPEAAAERLAAEELDSNKQDGSKQEAPPADNAEADQAGAEKIPVDVDGKIVALTKAEIAEHYKNGLRQADYTRKTMEVADQRRQAEAATSQAAQERHAYAEKLNVLAIQLHGALEEQSQIDWQRLLDTDPIEYMKQERIFNQRQAALQQANAELTQYQHIQQAEHQRYLGEFLTRQQQELVAKLPDWRDPAKRTTEAGKVKEFLGKQGFTAQEIGSLVDHRQVLLARDAMLYRDLMARAANATRKVANLPTKVERPGTGNAMKSDRSGDAMKRLSRSGSVEDAASVFAGLI